MGQDPEKLPKIVDLSEARKKQKSVQFGKGGKGAKPKNSATLTGRGRTFWTYVQFIVFLGAVAYFMQLCSSSSLF